MKPHAASRALALLSILTAARASPILEPRRDAERPGCFQRHCLADDGLGGFQVGKTYLYSYGVTTLSEMRGASHQRAKLDLSARVAIRADSPCEYTVEVEKVASEGDHDVDALEAVRHHPIRFAVEGQTIVEVCSHPRDPDWVVNVKKAVVSALQLSVNPRLQHRGNVTETDVVGTCLTEYARTLESLLPRGRIAYRKTKFMETCENNQRLFQFALNLPDVNVQNLPLLKSEHVCDASMDSNGLIVSSECRESHRFQPFSSRTSGATTHVTQSLAFIESLTRDHAVSLESGLVSNLEYSHPDAGVGNPESEARSILTRFSASPEPAKAELFMSLVHLLRRLSYPEVARVFYGTSGDARKVLLDAIPLIKSEAGVALMAEVMRNKLVPLSELDAWYSTLSFYKNPTRAMITAVSVFVDGETPPKSALMGVSTLVQSFCLNRAGCQDLPEISEIVSKFERLLGSQCHSMGVEEEDSVILALKALKNIGHLERSHEILERCYSDYTNSMFIRLAALDTIRRVSCVSPYDFASKLFETFSAPSGDSELRIGAYLALMPCPNKATVDAVKELLTHEEVNQVGSFVWTHLTNMQETKSHFGHKRELKALIGDGFLRNKWKTDVRQFSRYFEASYYWPELKAEAALDGQLIFSQNSYIPRSALVNVSASLFGQSVNLLEFGGRAEGFEDTIESMIGPNGYFRDDTFHKLLSSLRQKRNLADFQATFNQDLQGEPQAKLFMRVLGKEAHYLSFSGLPDLLGGLASTFPDFSRSSIFLDGKIVAPTVGGLPLSLGVNGTSTVSLKSMYTADVGGLFTTGVGSLTVKVYPSATVRVAGVMSVDARFATAGLKSVCRLHTSTFMDAKVEVSGSKVANVDVNMPRDTVDIVDATVDFFALANGKEEAIVSRNQRNEYKGCTPSLVTDVFGVQLCGSAVFYDNLDDSLDLLFAGPFFLNAQLHKMDEFYKYTFRYAWDDEGEGCSLRAFFDTPGSRVNRKSNVNLVYSPRSLTVDVEVPIRNTAFHFVHDWKERKKITKASLSVNDETIYSSFFAYKNPLPYAHEAHAMVSWQGSEVLQWKGELDLKDAKRTFLSDLRWGIRAQPVLARGEITLQEDHWLVDAAVDSRLFSVEVAVIFHHTDASFNAKGDLSFAVNGGDKHVVKVDSYYKLDTYGVLDKHAFFLHINPLGYSKWNSAVNWEVNLSPNYLHNNIKARYGHSSFSTEQLFSNQALVNYQELLLKASFQLPDIGFDYLADFEHRLSPTENSNRLTVRLFPWVDLNAFVGQHFDESGYKMKAGLKASEVNVEGGLELARQLPKTVNGRAYVQWSESNIIRGDFELNERKAADVDYVITATLTMPHGPPINASGSVQITANAFKAGFACGRGSSELGASALLQRSKAGMLLRGNARTASTSYDLSVTAETGDSAQRLSVFLNAGVEYVFNIEASKNLEKVLLNCSWDAKNYASNRVIVTSLWNATSIMAEWVILDHKGLVTSAFGDNSIVVNARSADHQLSFISSYVMEPNNLGGVISLTSTIPHLEDAHFDFHHRVSSTGNADVLSSQIVLKLNAHEMNAYLSGEKDAHRGLVELRTTSSWRKLDGLLARLEGSKTAKSLRSSVMMAYSGETAHLELDFNHDKSKVGSVKLASTFDAVQSVNLGYQVDLGRHLALSTHASWNEDDLARVSLEGQVVWPTLDVNCSAFMKPSHTFSATTRINVSNEEALLFAQATYGTSLQAEVHVQHQLDPPTLHVAVQIEDGLYSGQTLAAALTMTSLQDQMSVDSFCDLNHARIASVHLNGSYMSLSDYSVSLSAKLMNATYTLHGMRDNVRKLHFDGKVVKRELTTSQLMVLLENEPATKKVHVSASHSNRASRFLMHHAIANDEHTSNLLIATTNETLELSLKTLFGALPSGQKVSSSLVIKSPVALQFLSARSEFVQLGNAVSFLLDAEADGERGQVDLGFTTRRQTYAAFCRTSGIFGDAKLNVDATSDSSLKSFNVTLANSSQETASLHTTLTNGRLFAAYSQAGQTALEVDALNQPMDNGLAKASIVISHQSRTWLRAAVDLSVRATEAKILVKSFCPWMFSPEYEALFEAEPNAMKVKGLVREIGDGGIAKNIMNAALSWNREDATYSLIVDLPMFKVFTAVDATSLQCRVEAASGKMLHLDGSYISGTIATISMATINWSPFDVKLVAQYDQSVNSFDFTYGQGLKTFSFNGRVSANANKHELMTELRSDFIAGFHNFSVKGYLDRSSADLITASLIGFSGTHVSDKLELNAFLSPTQGNASLSARLPSFGIEDRELFAQFSRQERVSFVQVMDNDREFKVTLENDGEDMLDIEITTPWPAYGHVQMHYAFISNGPERKLEAFINANQANVLAVNVLYGMQRELEFKMAAPPFGLNLELVYLLRHLGLFHASFSFNNLIHFGVENKAYEHATLAARIACHKPFLVSADYRWKNGAKEGQFVASIEYGGNSLHHTTMAIVRNEFSAGLDLTTSSPCLSKQELRMASHLLFDKSKTLANFSLLHGNTYVSSASSFFMTVDAFNGELRWNSSLEGFESVRARAKYNIATEPTASVSLECNGVPYFLSTRMSLKNVIPTINIATSFKGYEKLVFSGTFLRAQNKVELDFSLDQNGMRAFMMANVLKLSSDWSNFEVISHIVAPVLISDGLELECGWKYSNIDFSAFKVKWTSEKERYYVTGRLSLIDQEFEISAATPFDGFETLALSGKLGSTTLGKNFGVSYEHNAVRREASLSFEKDDHNVATIRMRTPFQGFQSVKLRSQMLADMGRTLDFGFENQGDENNFGLGLKYDFSRGLSSGLLLMKAKLQPPLGDLVQKLTSFEAKLQYNGVDGNLANGMDITSYIHLDENMLASAKVSHDGQTLRADVEATVMTPWSLHLKSDFSSHFMASYEKVGSSMSLSGARVGNGNFDIALKTPTQGYESVTATLRSEGTRSVVTVFRNNDKLSTFTIDADASWADKKARLFMKWEALQSLWTELNIEADSERIELSLMAPNKNWAASLHHKDDGEKNSIVLNASLNKETFFYSSERIWKSGHIVGSSKYLTTMNFFDTKQQDSTYDIKYSKDFSTPFELSYESTTDGASTFRLSLYLDIQPYQQVKFEGSIIIPEWSIDSKWTLLGKTDGDTFASIDGTYNTIKVSVKLERAPHKLSFEASSSIAGFEELELELEWMNENESTIVDYSAELNDIKLVQGQVIYDFLSAAPRFKISVQLDEDNQQSVEVKWIANDGNEFALHASSEGVFDTSSIDLKGTSDDGLANFDFAFKSPGSIVFFGKIDFVIKAAAKYSSESFGLKMLVKNCGVLYKGKLDLSHSGPMIGKSQLVVEFPSKKMELAAEYDFLSQEKVLSAKLKYGKEALFEFLTSIDWSFEASNVIVKGVFNQAKMELKLKRLGFKQIVFTVNALGTVATFEALNEIRSHYDFDIKTRLSGSSNAIPKIAFTLHSEQGIGDGDLFANGKIEYIRFPVSFNFAYKKAGHVFDLTVSSDQLADINGKISYGLKNGGKELAIQWKQDNLLTVFETISTSSHPVVLQYEENLHGSHGELTFDGNHGSVTFTDQMGQYSSTVDAELVSNSEEDGFTFTLQAASKLLPRPFIVLLTVVYPFTWKLNMELPDGNVVKFDGSVKVDFSHLVFSVMASDVEAVLTINNQDESKSIHFLYGDSIALTASLLPSTMALSWKSVFTEELVFHLDFTNEDAKLKLNYGTELIVGVDKTADIWSFNAVVGVNVLRLTVHFKDSTLAFLCKAAGMEIQVNSVVSGSGVTMEIREPFTSVGKVNLNGDWVATDQGFKVSASANVEGIHYALSGELDIGQGILSAELSHGSEAWTVVGHASSNDLSRSVSIAVSGTNFQPIEIKALYAYESNHFNASLVCIMPQFVKLLEVSLEAAYSLPIMVTLKSQVEGNSGRIFNLQAEFGLSENFSDLRGKLLIFCPPLGLEKDFKAEFAYRAVSLLDFEFIAGANVGDPYEAKLRFHLEEQSLDGLIALIWREQLANIKFGGHYAESDILHEFDAHINSLSLVGGRSKSDGNVTVAVSNADASLLPKKFNAVLEFLPGEGLSIHVTVDGEGHLSLLGKLSEKSSIFGSFSLQSDKHKIHRSSEVTIRYGSLGQIEITYGGFPKHSLRLELQNGSSRIARAVVHSPSHGTYELSLSQNMQSGVLVLATAGNNVHKLTYSVEVEEWFAFSARLDSPLLSEGSAHLQITLNPKANIYMSKLALNNRHFLSWSLSFDEQSIDGSLALQSPILPFPPVEASLRAKYSNLLFKVQCFGEHILEAQFDRLSQSAKARFSSPLIPDKECSFSASLSEAGNFDAVLHFAGDALEINAFAHLEAGHNVSALFVHRRPLGRGDTATLKLGYAFACYKDGLVHVSGYIASTHQVIPFLEFTLNLEELENGQRYRGTVIAKSASAYEAVLSWPKIASRSDFALLTISSSNCHSGYQFKLSWDLDQSSALIISMNGPAHEIVVASIVATSSPIKVTMEISSTVSFIPSKAAVVLKIVGNSTVGTLSLLTSCNNDEALFELHHTLTSEKVCIQGKFVTPQHKYKLQLGYENSARKMLRAHVEHPGAQLGIQMEYFFSSLLDFIVEAKIDLPIPILNATFVKLGHSYSESEHYLAIGAGKQDFGLLAESRLKLAQFSADHDFEVSFKNYSLASHLHADMIGMEIEARFNLRCSPECQFETNLKATLEQLGLDAEFSIAYNHEPRLVLLKNLNTRTILLHAKNIFSSVEFKTSAFLGDASWQSSSEVIWDTSRPDETKEAISFGFCKTEVAREFAASITWRTKTIDAFSAKSVCPSSGDCSASLSLHHDNRKMFAIDFHSNSGTSTQDAHDTKVAFVLPSHVFEYYHLRKKSPTGIFIESRLLHGKSSDFLRGVTYAFSCDTIDGSTAFSSMELRLIGKTKQTFSAMYQTKKEFWRSLKLKSVNDADPELTLHLEALLDMNILSLKDRGFDFNVNYVIGASTGDTFAISGFMTDAAKKSFALTLKNSSTIYKILGELDMDSSRGGFSVTRDEFVVGTINGAMNTTVPSVSFEAELGGGNVRAYAGLTEPNLIEIFVRGSGSPLHQESIEMVASVGLSPNGRTLTSNMTWTPLAHERLIEVTPFSLDPTVILPPQLRNISSVVRAIAKNSWATSIQDLRTSLEWDGAIYENVLADLNHNLKSLHVAEPLDAVIKSFSDSIAQSLQLITSVMKIGFQSLDRLVEFCGRTLPELLDCTANFLGDLLRDSGGFIRSVFENMAFKVNVELPDEKLRMIVVAAHDALLWVSQGFGDLKNDLSNAGGEQLSLAWVNTRREVWKYLKSIEELALVMDVYYEYQSWLEEVHFSAKIDMATRELERCVSRTLAQMSSAKASALGWWSWWMDEMTSYPLIAYAGSVGRKALRVAHGLVEEYGLGSGVRSLASRALGQAEAVCSVVSRLVDVALHREALVDYDFAFDLSAGYARYAQLLPFQWYRFGEAPDLAKAIDLLTTADHHRLDYLAFQHEIVELVGVVSQALDSHHLIPPFSASALLAGDAHIVTFDQRFYDLSPAAGCSYLLASDFSQGRFSVIAKYDAQMRRSAVDVVSDGRTISVHTANKGEDVIKVTVDKRTTELPLAFDRTFAYRREGAVVIEVADGLKVICGPFNVCSFTLSGWQFGKTGGLLGTFDNEPANDWMTPRRQLTPDLGAFASSWSLNACPPQPSKEVVTNRQVDEVEACEAVFSRNDSALMPCFAALDPHPFRRMCLSDMKGVKNEAVKSGGVCGAAAAYIQQCRLLGVELWMPSACVRCDNSLHHGESSIYENNSPKSADVVFIVQQCSASADLAQLPHLIDTSLTAKGLVNNRYALVGFGGGNQLDQPLIFTSGSRVFNRPLKMGLALANLKDDGPEKVDVGQALHFAARLNFRPGVIKTFVVATCNSSNMLSANEYGDAMTMLTEQGIVAHLVTPLSLKTGIFGFSRSGVIRGSGLDEDSSQRRALKVPKQLLTTLVQDVNGVVFDLDRLRRQQKRASNAFTKALATLTKPLECQVCDCLSGADASARLMCHKCILPSIDLVLQDMQM